MDLLASPPTPDTPLTGEQKAWIAGYLAGLKARPDVTAPAGGEELLVLYGTQSGNAEWVAVQVQRLAAPRGLVCRVADMDEVDIADIAAARKILIVVSTYGEGDMPDNAADLWRAVASNDAPRLDGVEVAVCGLGDSSYDGFCQTAINLDTRLAELGARRVVARAECDVDFQAAIDTWLPRALDQFAGITTSRTAGECAPGTRTTARAQDFLEPAKPLSGDRCGEQRAVRRRLGERGPPHRVDTRRQRHRLPARRRFVGATGQRSGRR